MVGTFVFRKRLFPPLVHRMFNIQQHDAMRCIRPRDNVVTILQKNFNCGRMSSFDITEAELSELLEILHAQNLSPSLQHLLSKIRTAQDAAWANSDFGLEPAPITVNTATPSWPWQGIVSNDINLSYAPCDIYYYVLFSLGPSFWLATHIWVPVLQLVFWDISASPYILQLTFIT